MKLTPVILVVLALAVANIGTARAETAIGAVFGYPGNIGLSMRFDRTPINVAWSDNYVHGTMDWWLKRTPLDNPKMSWYYGAGADAGIPFDSDHDFFLAGRVPFGLTFMPSPKLELFGELAPGIQVLHDLDFYWAGNVGVRFVLGK